MDNGIVPCWIYKGDRHRDTFLYLVEEDGFHRVPAELMVRMGTLQLVMRLDLHPGRRLARENILTVLEDLRTKGYHLQLSPKIEPGHFALE